MRIFLIAVLLFQIVLAATSLEGARNPRRSIAQRFHARVTWMIALGAILLLLLAITSFNWWFIPAVSVVAILLWLIHALMQPVQECELPPKMRF